MVCLDGSLASQSALDLALRIVRPDLDSLLLFSTAYALPSHRRRHRPG